MDALPPGREPTLIDPRTAVTGRLPVPAATPDVLGGRYRLSERIGRGGMSEVWQGKDELLDRPVAVKLLHPMLAQDVDARARFAIEARRAAQLSHPRVVRVLDAGTDGDDAYIVMELIEGPPLSTVIGPTDGVTGDAGQLPADRVLTADRVLAIGLQVAEALGAAHEIGMIHRDVKPSNILLADDGAMLTDFGIARAAGEASITETGQMVGTAAYLAPEQANGEPATPASDVYALGLVLFQAMTGRARFAGEGPLQTALARVGAVTTVADLGATVPAEAAAAVVALLAVDPRDRPADGHQAGVVLANAVGLLADGGAAADGPAADVHPPHDARLTSTTRLDRPAAPAPEPGSSGMEAGPVQARPAAAPRSSAGPSAAPRPSAGQSEGVRSSSPRGGDRRRWPVAVGGAALLVLALALAGWGLRPTAGPVGPTEGPTPVAAAVVGFSSFDPEGGGTEHEDEVALLTDGDPATRWSTEGYSTATFGNLKSGVGVVLDLGEPVVVSELRLLGLSEGQHLQLLTAETMPATLEDTTVVAEVAAAGTEAALRPEQPLTVRWLVVWLTGPLPADGGRFRGAIGEIEVVAA